MSVGIAAIAITMTTWTIVAEKCETWMSMLQRTIQISGYKVSHLFKFHVSFRKVSDP